MEEQKRRAEADKLAAITALEQRSREFMREKEEKRRLETRIANMQSQLLIGGSKLEDTPVFRCPTYQPKFNATQLCLTLPGGTRSITTSVCLSVSLLKSMLQAISVLYAASGMIDRVCSCRIRCQRSDKQMACRTLLAREQRRMRGEYEIRLRELERERIHAEQDKAQVTSCKDRHISVMDFAAYALRP